MKDATVLRSSLNVFLLKEQCACINSEERFGSTRLPGTRCLFVFKSWKEAKTKCQWTVFAMFLSSLSFLLYGVLFLNCYSVRFNPQQLNITVCNLVKCTKL